MVEGGCFCGFIRYRVTGVPTNETNCHCSICRRTSAAAFVSWLTVSASEFRLTAGEPVEFQSSDHGRRTFCPKCGTPLTFCSARSPGEIDVTTCSLDRPELFPPLDHTHAERALPWVALGELPVYPRHRGST